jgi:hypothetical protein
MAADSTGFARAAHLEVAGPAFLLSGILTAGSAFIRCQSAIALALGAIACATGARRGKTPSSSRSPPTPCATIDWIPADRGYHYGVFNPVDGVGTPFFGGYYGPAGDDDEPPPFPFGRPYAN